MYIHIYLEREREQWSKYGKILTFGEFEWRVFKISLYSSDNFPTSLKLHQKNPKMKVGWYGIISQTYTLEEPSSDIKMYMV